MNSSKFKLQKLIRTIIREELRVREASNIPTGVQDPGGDSTSDFFDEVQEALRGVAKQERLSASQARLLFTKWKDGAFDEDVHDYLANGEGDPEAAALEVVARFKETYEDEV